MYDKKIIEEAQYCSEIFIRHVHTSCFITIDDDEEQENRFASENVLKECFSLYR